MGSHCLPCYQSTQNIVGTQPIITKDQSTYIQALGRHMVSNQNGFVCFGWVAYSPGGHTSNPIASRICKFVLQEGFWAWALAVDSVPRVQMDKLPRGVNWKHRFLSLIHFTTIPVGWLSGSGDLRRCIQHSPCWGPGQAALKCASMVYWLFWIKFT